MITKKFDLPVNYEILDQGSRRLVRLQYIQEQHGLCYYCKKSLTDKPQMTRKIRWGAFPPNFMKNPIHLHHSHETGMTIGAVHAYCNAVLWQYHGE